VCTDYQLLARLEADRESVGATNIDDLEADIDEAVYDLFDLTDDEYDFVNERQYKIKRRRSQLRSP
jgi:hypothetical protein